MVRYYKLFDLLNRRGMNKSSLLEILSSKTIAKLSKGENINTDVINKICLFLGCQPSDIMEVVTETDEIEMGVNKKAVFVEKDISKEEYNNESFTEESVEIIENGEITGKQIIKPAP